MDEVYSADGQVAPAATDILAALHGMWVSEAFRLSNRNRRFLSFVVRQAVEGRSDRIKAYVIGVDVFGRDHSFDPTLDPIVRIEADCLRTALSAHYDAQLAPVDGSACSPEDGRIRAGRTNAGNSQSCTGNGPAGGRAPEL